jgi:hypothetical protein
MEFMVIDVAAALGLFNSAKDTLMTVTGLAKKLKSHEVNAKVSELSNTLAEVQIQIMTVMEKANAVQAENERLKAELKQRDEFKFNDDEGYYEQVITAGLTGIFCPRCYDKDGKPVRMLKHVLKNYKCPECDTQNKPVTRPTIKFSSLQSHRRDEHDPAMG